MANCVIFGAGKISRGFIAHLLTLSRHKITFIENYHPLVNELKSRKKYHINVYGNNEKSIDITEFEVLSLEEDDNIQYAVSHADVIFTAIGGKNLNLIAPIIYNGIKNSYTHDKPVNIITCENWKNPSSLLKSAIYSHASEFEKVSFDKWIGVSEAVILRSAIEPDNFQKAIDPLWVNVQDYWELPVDGEKLKGKLPSIMSLKTLNNFSGFLEKKFYTYNAANGTTSFLGALKGYKYIFDAAHDKDILFVLNNVYSETATALSSRLGLPIEDLLAFGKTSLDKLQDTHIVDYVERNARDPIRKLGPDDRLVAPAQMCLVEGVVPHGLATAIAAAIHYPVVKSDPSSQQLRDYLNNNGSSWILENICKISRQSSLHSLILEKENLVAKTLLPKG